MFRQALHKPRTLRVDRAAGLLAVIWVDGHESRFSLHWLRAYCPCATCREARRKAVDPAADLGMELTLNAGPKPTDQVSSAELVGGYALRITWTDGHDTGIYAFSSLRDSCPCPFCNPDGPPPLILD